LRLRTPATPFARERTVIRKATLGVEQLEVRDCPATVNITYGTLTVTGTEGNDTIILGQSQSSIFVNGAAYSRAGVARIVVTAGGGDDVIRDGSGFGAIIYGGLGNDNIASGTGNDRVYGGAGNDVINGGEGNDVLWGGGGTDTLIGGPGTNNVQQDSPAGAVANTAIETEIIRLVNVQRVAAGLPPLRVNLKLNAAATFHSQDMAALSPGPNGQAAMRHTLYGTARPEISNRLDLAGYDTWTQRFGYGENIAYGFTNAASVMNAWMGSAGHRANILRAGFTEIGVSVRADAFGRLFFTQVFGHSQ
jgi:uncharacterized protein YkwD